MLKVGDLQFTIDDMPDTLVVGVTLKSVELNLSDGSRKLQKFGSTADDIAFQGTFMYEGAHDRAWQLKNMAQETASVLFVCDGFSCPVSVKDAKLTIHNEAMVDYSVTLFIEKTAPVVVMSSSTSLSQIHTTTQQAQSSVNQTGNQQAIASMGFFVSTLQGYGK